MAAPTTTLTVTPTTIKEGTNATAVVKLVGNGATFASKTRIAVVSAGLNVQVMSISAKTGISTPLSPIATDFGNAQTGGYIEISSAPQNGETWTITFTVRAVAGAYGPTQLQSNAKVVSSSNATLYDVSAAKAITISSSDGQGVAPPVPSAVTAAAKTPLQIDVTSVVSANTDTIEVRHSLTAAGAKTVVGEFSVPPSGIPVVAVTGLSADTKYFFGVRAHNQWGTSAWSSNTNVYATTPSMPAAPTAVSDSLTAVAKSPTSIQLNFTPSAKVTEDNIEYDNSYYYEQSTDGVVWTRPNSGEFVGPPIIVTGLSANTLYYFRVYAKNLGGSTVSTSVNARTLELGTAVPTAPSAFTVAATAGTYGSMDLAWTDNTQVEQGYKFRYSSTAATGPWIETVTLPPDTTSYQHTGLTPGTTYYYELWAFNTNGESTRVTGNAALAAAPAIPGAPTNLTAEVIDDGRARLSFQPAAPFTAQKYELRRSSVSGSGYVTIAELSGNVSDTSPVVYEDTGLDAGATYYYVVRGVNWAGNSAYSAEVSITTKYVPVEIASTPGFTFDPRSDNRIYTFMNRTYYTSNYERTVVRYPDGSFFKEALKRPLAAHKPVLSSAAGGGGTLAAGNYRVYTKLLRYPEVRSDNADSSNILALTLGDRIKITFPLDGDSKVYCRDIGYDVSGNLIDGAQYVEIYIASEGSANALLLDTLPLLSTTWEATPGVGDYIVDPALTYADLFSTGRRPMELLGQNSLGPCCTHRAFRGSRGIAFGEVTIAPDSDDQDAGATLAITAGTKEFTTSNYDLPEGALMKELWINGRPTGWEIYDIEGNTGYIRHGDPAKNESGFDGAGGSFPNFKFSPFPSRAHYTAYYSGGIGFAWVFSPETYPPLTKLGPELYPDDGTDPNGAVVAGEATFISKPSKWLLLTGGTEPDVPVTQVRALSDTSGCNAPKTICMDRQNTIYYLGDTGVHRVTQAGVERIIDYTGNARLFRDVVDIASIPDSVGEYFSREEWVVFANLNLIGNSGRRDVIIYDVRNNVILSQPHNIQVTSLKQAKNVQGEYQLVYGDSNQNVGTLFTKGVKWDGISYATGAQESTGAPLSGFSRSGIVDSEHAVTLRSVQTRLWHNLAGVDHGIRFVLGGNARNGAPWSFTPKRTIRKNSTDLPDKFDFPGNFQQQAMLEFQFTTSPTHSNADFSWSNFQLQVMTRGAS
jgi:hypothetical protein